VGFDELELALRRLPGVVAVGCTEAEDLLVVEVQAGPGAGEEVAREATVLARQELADRHPQIAVEVVRWGDGPTRPPGSRLRLVEVTTDTSAGELAVHLAHGEEQAVGRAPTAHGLLAVVEATVSAILTFVPDLTYLPGWARTVETTPERRFLVVASVTDPEARAHLRGAAEGATPLDAAARATLAALNRTISREL
jgi:hypothetical protein